MAPLTRGGTQPGVLPRGVTQVCVPQVCVPQGVYPLCVSPSPMVYSGQNVRYCLRIIIIIIELLLLDWNTPRNQASLRLSCGVCDSGLQKVCRVVYRGVYRDSAMRYCPRAGPDTNRELLTLWQPAHLRQYLPPWGTSHPWGTPPNPLGYTAQPC